MNPLVILLLLFVGFASFIVLRLPIPLPYNLKNVFVRWRSTSATILGVALVVTVFILLHAMAAGLEKSSANTGDPRNVMVVRKGSTAESSSVVTLDQFKLIKYLPQIAHDAQGNPIISADLAVIINLPRRDGAGEANVTMRGVTPMGKELRPQVKLVNGRWFTPGKREVVASLKMAKRFSDTDIGQKFRTAGKDLTVVGWFDGGDSAFDSEIWMDADEARSVFDRENYCSLLARLANTNDIASFTNRVESEKRMALRADFETKYYAEQTSTAGPIKFLGSFLAVAMSIGAVFAAMNTMYAAVGARTREIGTLRVLGFRRRVIMVSFVLEGVILAGVGGVIGCVLALLVQWYCLAFGVHFGTLSFNTFSEVIFQFRVTPGLVAEGMVFAIVVGIVGSFLPAIRAARLPVIAALKAV